jgi:hypothetical protein
MLRTALRQSARVAASASARASVVSDPDLEFASTTVVIRLICGFGSSMESFLMILRGFCKKSIKIGCAVVGPSPVERFSSDG